MKYSRATTRAYDHAVRDALVRNGLHAVLAQVFAARGVRDADALQDDLRRLAPPASLMGLEAACELLVDLIEAQGSVCVVADYDCDGATACAVAVLGLRRLGANVDFLVPNRFETGYGLTPEVVRLAAEHPRLGCPDLIVTVDNGIASHDGVQAAHELGIAVLVTDHHLPGDQPVDAEAIVNPNQVGCPFPSKHLAGVGVVFYLLMALRAQLRALGHYTEQTQPRLDDLLDLVALGTVADVVQLDRNNRILVAQGLRRIRAGKARPGLQSLFAVAARDPQQASTFDLGFALGPRINAAGRMSDMSIGVACLLADQAEQAHVLAEQLDQLNRERRQTETDARDQALTQLPAIAPNRYSIVLYDAQWHQGVIGLVASRVKDQHHRPTIVFAQDQDGQLKGSGRSIAGLHLRDCLDRVAKSDPGLIIKFGGHAMAAGLTIASERLAAFEAAFEQAAAAMLTPNDLQNVLETDGSLPEDCDLLQLAELIEQQIWGQGFQAPVFIDEFRVLEQRLLKEQHLKLVLSRGRGRYEAIWFNHAEPLATRTTLAYRVAINRYQNQAKVQLMIEAQFE